MIATSWKERQVSRLKIMMMAWFKREDKEESKGVKLEIKGNSEEPMKVEYLVGKRKKFQGRESSSINTALKEKSWWIEKCKLWWKSK
jgi:hypothetical protein